MNDKDIERETVSEFESLSSVDKILCRRLITKPIKGTWEHNVPPKRKNFSKQVKDIVLHKFGCRCSYCGCELNVKNVQIDHICPVYIYGDNNHIDNLIPACRYCNFIKSTDSINGFRRHLMHMVETMHKKDATFRMLERYGFVDFCRPPIHFWFEEYMEGREEAMRNAYRRMNCYS